MKKNQNQLSLILICLFFIPLSMQAQEYGTALGVRAADGIGVTLQQQIAVHSTVEGILSSKSKNLTLNLLYEHHKNLITSGLNFYAGAGVYKTWLNKDENLIEQPTNPYGISPIIGIEMTIAKLNISADIKPHIRVGGTGGKGLEWNTGVSVRYVLAKRYFKNDNWKFWKKWKKK